MSARPQPEIAPTDRLRELASILAAAVVRRMALDRRIAPQVPGISQESSASGLEVPAPLPLSVGHRTRG